ncbi:venom serine carboxypeptidase-like [Anticarsia gemmatalis]|uniref:venom serine carboxypeptidase-like n=1 Tax=Anticarsia gemmatalis TaxID=129554 RepID=UPI003F773419
MKNVCLLILCVVSIHGKLAEDVHKEEISNLIVDIKAVKTETSIVNNTSEVRRTDTSDNLINVSVDAKNTQDVNSGPCLTNKELVDNLVNANYSVTGLLLNNLCRPKPKPEVKVDNGTALLLTKYINEGKVKEARAACKVDSNVFLGIKSYSGFFTVNETYNSNVFFWYFPVLNKSVSDSPWIIWLQGGPGASSLTGLFDEIGPFTYTNDELRPNPYTWLQNHSLLFIDNPVGTGYSFTEHSDGYVTDMASYANHLYSTLKQFLLVFPELKTAPLYLAGESYAGKYVPAMAMEIHRRTQGKPDPGVNLQGLIVGNAYIDPDMISHLAWPFYYFGLLEKEQLEIVKPLVDSFHEDIKANRSIEAKNKWNSLITVLLFLTHQKHAYNFLRDELPVGKYIKFLQTSEVKKAIHVGDIHFGFVNMTVNTRLAPDFLSTTKPMFERLLDHYRVLAYCGQLDQMLPCVFTSENYRTWKWNGTEEFKSGTRFPYIYNNRLSGYHKSGGRLTEVVIRGAGHMAPLDAPGPTQNLVSRWTHEKPLSVRYGLLEGSFVQEFVRNNSLIHYL